MFLFPKTWQAIPTLKCHLASFDSSEKLKNNLPWLFLRLPNSPNYLIGHYIHDEYV